MIRIALLISVFLTLFSGIVNSQGDIKTSDLFKRQESGNSSGNLTINQDPRIDTLMSRYILNNSKIRTSDGVQGIWGFRIQIYRNNVRAARDESAKAQSDFISKFPEIQSYRLTQPPATFIVRAGDYRTKTEGYKDLRKILKEFPNAYIVPDVINFPDV